MKLLLLGCLVVLWTAVCAVADSDTLTLKAGENSLGKSGENLRKEVMQRILIVRDPTDPEKDPGGGGGGPGGD